MASSSRAAPEVSADERNNRLCQFTKTKLCKFHAVGKCTKGTMCPFAHEGLDLRKLPDLRCTKICKALIQTGQCTKKPCMYAHSKQELRSTGAFHKTKLCRFMQTGHCTLGAKCNFAHSAVELREPETIEGVDPPPGLGGLESMISGLLSDDDDDTEHPPPGLEKASRRVDHKDIKSELPLPAYVGLGPSSDSWSFGASITPETMDRKDPMKAFKEADVGTDSFWDVQNLLAANGSPGFSGLGCYSPEGNNLAYGGAFNDFSSPWAGGLLLEQYASLFGNQLGNTWDWQLFGDSAVIDQKDEMKIKSELLQPPRHLWQDGGNFTLPMQQ